MAGNRGDVDDGAAAGAQHDGGCGLHHQERAGQVGGHDGLPDFVAGLGDGTEVGDAGIVDQRVEPAEVLCRLVHGALHVFGHGDIAIDAQTSVGEWLWGCAKRFALLSRAHLPAIVEEVLTVSSPMPRAPPVTRQTLRWGVMSKAFR